MEHVHIASPKAHPTRTARGLRSLFQFPSHRPARGMAVAFKRDASETLGGIPARVTDVWPRLSSGDYLVTLEFREPVKFRKAYIRHIEAFMSDLDPVPALASS